MFSSDIVSIFGPEILVQNDTNNRFGFVFISLIVFFSNNSQAVAYLWDQVSEGRKEVLCG
jgi:hypothetical protein